MANESHDNEGDGIEQRLQRMLAAREEESGSSSSQPVLTCSVVDIEFVTPTDMPPSADMVHFFTDTVYHPSAEFAQALNGGGHMLGDLDRRLVQATVGNQDLEFRAPPRALTPADLQTDDGRAELLRHIHKYLSTNYKSPANVFERSLTLQRRSFVQVRGFDQKVPTESFAAVFGLVVAQPMAEEIERAKRKARFTPWYELLMKHHTDTGVDADLHRAILASTWYVHMWTERERVVIRVQDTVPHVPDFDVRSAMDRVRQMKLRDVLMRSSGNRGAVREAVRNALAGALRHFDVANLALTRAERLLTLSQADRVVGTRDTFEEALLIIKENRNSGFGNTNVPGGCDECTWTQRYTERQIPAYVHTTMSIRDVEGRPRKVPFILDFTTPGFYQVSENGYEAAFDHNPDPAFMQSVERNLDRLDWTPVGGDDDGGDPDSDDEWANPMARAPVSSGPGGVVKDANKTLAFAFFTPNRLHVEYERRLTDTRNRLVLEDKELEALSEPDALDREIDRRMNEAFGTDSDVEDSDDDEPFDKVMKSLYRPVRRILGSRVGRRLVVDRDMVKAEVEARLVELKATAEHRRAELERVRTELAAYHAAYDESRRLVLGFRRALCAHEMARVQATCGPDMATFEREGRAIVDSKLAIRAVYQYESVEAIMARLGDDDGVYEDLRRVLAAEVDDGGSGKVNYTRFLEEVARHVRA